MNSTCRIEGNGGAGGVDGAKLQSLHHSLLVPSRQSKKTSSTELFWINLFANSIPSFRNRAESDDSVADAPAKAEKFAQRQYKEILEDLKKDPESHGGPPPHCILLCRFREQEVGFGDIFKKVKDEENVKAIFKDVVHLNDADDSRANRASWMGNCRAWYVLLMHARDWADGIRDEESAHFKTKER